jgi:hypothetical protein
VASGGLRDMIPAIARTGAPYLLHAAHCILHPRRKWLLEQLQQLQMLSDGCLTRWIVTVCPVPHLSPHACCALFLFLSLFLFLCLQPWPVE